MSDLVERGAREVLEHLSSDNPFADEAPFIHHDAVSAKQVFRRAAAFLLREMGEPSEAMLCAHRDVCENYRLPGADVRWKAMLQAFMKEHDLAT